MSKQVFIAPHKDIVASEAQELRRKIFSIIGEKPEKLVVDLEAVRVIDSIGLGVLISARNHLKKSGGELVVTNVSKEVAHLLRQMHLDRHIVFKAVD
ncbi:MAG TPA: STAS domain-containing protein [Syntrophales bacterium]|nr:STAS domain-containing protein [Syntrophales bacterium]HOX93676.1 STAS domain-containing protein [Syntrophales bacterium]HPI56586.1 STAS domain-containing protein [Syntrophales bacterium]HPN24993.1 STAS domain-containing protein [Syntrophales bacterium]HQM29265.1 STAS domain-containing protein [Syntrophales bacterium]